MTFCETAYSAVKVNEEQYKRDPDPLGIKKDTDCKFKVD
jgi:hypothetical protein